MKLGPILGVAGLVLAGLVKKGGVKLSIDDSEVVLPAAEHHKRLVRKLYRDIWNVKDKKKRKAAIEELVAEDHVLVDPTHPSPGSEPYEDMVSAFREGLPNARVCIDMMIAEGSRVVTLLSIHSGPVPNTTREATWTSTCIMEFAAGQCIRTWVNSDSLSALIQLDLIPDIVSGPFKRGFAAANSAKAAFNADSITKPLVQALLGRSEEHPEAVLTGKDW
eukprot:CAMPEP_0197857190 /NCGR_PEP_ID=MMETSP1438-20131217/30019_1 /TAXON_ID=1461541 /ORGANISM="Pterosperma sp., Strain CCMP1384" /LENGTH=219 /DNA_ID=CAMNT_0043472925 /DNA_START=101 /DNA_END=757 /DNA_ORIENTATION=+